MRTESELRALGELAMNTKDDLIRRIAVSSIAENIMASDEAVMRLAVANLVEAAVLGLGRPRLKLAPDYVANEASES